MVFAAVVFPLNPTFGTSDASSRSFISESSQSNGRAGWNSLAWPWELGRVDEEMRLNCFWRETLRAYEDRQVAGSNKGNNRKHKNSNSLKSEAEET